MFVLIYYVTGYRKKVVAENLRNAFPEKTEEERIVIQKKFFRYFADLIMEIIKGISISERELDRRFKTTNVDLVEHYFAEGKSIIGAVGHYCNWEMAALHFSRITRQHRVIVYKPLSNKTVDDFFIKIRSRFGATLVAMKNTLRKLTQLRRELSMTVLVADQTPVKHEAHYFTDFLNQPTAVFLGVEKLAKMIDGAVIFCDIRRVKRGYYINSFITLTGDAKNTSDYEITELHVKYLESMIRREPQYWLWSHRRWKFKPEDKQ